MKRLMFSVAAVLILPITSACADQTRTTEAEDDDAVRLAVAEPERDAEVERDAGVNQYDQEMEQDRARAQSPTDQQMAAGMTGNMVTFEANEFSARELLGEPIEGAAGERLARVDDLVIGENGQVQSVIILSGGEFFGLEGKPGLVEFNRATFNIEERAREMGEERVKVSMNQASLDGVRSFDREAINDYTLATDIIGASAQFSNGQAEEATITDLILTRDGKVKHVIVRDAAVPTDRLSTADRAMTGRLLALDYSALSVEEGAGGFVLDVTSDALRNAPRFDYQGVAQGEQMRYDQNMDTDMRNDMDVNQ